MIKRIVLPSLILIVALTSCLIPIRAESASSGSFSITVTVPLEVIADIITPGDGQVCSETPTITGTTNLPNETVEIRGTSAGSEVVVATTTSDSNGNFTVEVNPATPLSLGDNTLTPYVDGNPGLGKTPLVSANPNTTQEPTITSVAEGERIKGDWPTISGLGKAGATVKLYTKDPDGTVIQIGEGTVNSEGEFSIIPSGDIVLGAYQIYVVIDEIASGIITITFVDPYGIVYDSETNLPIEGAVVTLQRSLDGGLTWNNAEPEVDIAATDINPQATGVDGAYSYLTVNGDFRLLVNRIGYDFPSTVIPIGSPHTGSHGELFTVGGVILNIDLPLDFSGEGLLKVSKDANKLQVSIGDIITYTVTINNEGTNDVTNVYLKDKLAAGFKYLEGKVLLDGNKISDPAGTRTKTFNIGTVPASSSKTLKYQVVVGSGVTFGNYENKAWCEFSNGRRISNSAARTVKVIPEPLFDLGTIIGKVFWDRNENGVQDEGEVLVPNVQIATEDGTLITTDNYGKYHLAAIMPGRHLLRIDERSLPKGAYLTTDKVVIVDVTPGMLFKVNFGVKASDSQIANKMQTPFTITQERSKPEPRLNAGIFKDELIIVDDKLVEPVFFRIFTNYSLFIEKWRLEILDKDTKNMVKSFEGSRLNINEPIYWDGKAKNNKLITEGRNYVYVLTVTGRDEKQDVTKERKLTVRSQGIEDGSINSENEIQKERQQWIEQESKVNNLAQQNIRVEGETILVTGHRSPVTSIRVMKGEKLEGEITVAQSQGMVPSDILEASQIFEEAKSEAITDIILPEGEYDIEIIPEIARDKIQRALDRQEQKTDINYSTEGQTDGQGLEPITETYIKHIKVEEDYLFLVGMGDVKAGYNFNKGDLEPVKQDDKFKEGFWSEGKLAYYLKGKIKGKYLITSSLDTERDKKELFRNLDPDIYYPVYGDSSSVNYAATDTQGVLYLLVEWDKSSALWGNYNTDLSDTEFASFNRSLYGGKVNLESVSTTKFGEPNTRLIVFRARAQQRASHNEFLGTGGSLFYLKHRDVIEGSDRVKIEVRDKITGLVMTSREMTEGNDYEIDYSNGRIIFWKPVSQLVESGSIISSSLSGGNPVYVVVDYEYETKDKLDEGTTGGRLQQSLTDYLRIGATYVKEEQLNNYELKGVDTIVHLGKDIKLTGEYAESKSEGVGSFISTDGGLSFTELATGVLDKGKAYGLKAEARLLNRIGIIGYYKQIEKGFSSTSTVSEQGKELMGVGATFDLAPKTRLKATHDIQKLIGGGNLQTQLQVGAQETETTTAQITHEMERLKLTGEYRQQKVKNKLEEFESETNKEEDILAIRADYKATDKVTVSLEEQLILKGGPDNQVTAGVSAEINKNLSLRAKEVIGTQGTATGVGVTANVKDRLELTGDFTKANSPSGVIGDTASIGGKAMVNDKTELHTNLAVTDSLEGGKTQSIVFGSKRKINEELSLSSDRTYAKNKDKQIQANIFALTREKEGRELEGTFTEQRSHSDTEVSNTNIFGLSGDINDKWAAQGAFERGTVQNHDGTQASRHAGSFGLGFLDSDTLSGETKLKASSKLELRLDDGRENKRQYLVYNAIESKINPNTTIFAKANLSQTKNTTNDLTEAQYKELVAGVAYRPISFDKLNLLGKYTYLEDISPLGQSVISDIKKEKSHTLSTEAVYDLTKKWQIAEKLAYKMGEEKVSGFDFTKTQTWLMAHRLNYNINRNWQIGAEYRLLTQKEAKDSKQGALFEVSRKIGDFIQVGLGYNFTNFNDDLAHLDYTSRGPFIRLTGKFYDRIPESFEALRDRQIERQFQAIKHLREKQMERQLTKEEGRACMEEEIERQERLYSVIRELDRIEVYGQEYSTQW